MFPAKIPSTNAAAEGCIFLKCWMFSTAVALIISGLGIPAFSCKALGWDFLFDKTCDLKSKSSENKNSFKKDFSKKPLLCGEKFKLV